MKGKTVFLVGVLFALGFCLAYVSVGTAGIRAPTNFYEICASIPRKDRGNLQLCASVKERQLDLTGGPERLCDYRERNESRPNRWLVLGTKIKASVGGGYLAYDLSGKDPKVFLTRDTMKAGVGTDWTIRRSNRKDDFREFIKAASGKVKGWYLDLEGEGVYDLILRQDGEETKVYIKQLLSYRATAR